MSDSPPDRISATERSRYYNAELLERGIGIRFNGKERNDVEEYCVSEGWIRVPVGKSLDRRGDPITFKMTGTVEAYFKDQAGAPDSGTSEQ